LADPPLWSHCSATNQIALDFKKFHLLNWSISQPLLGIPTKAGQGSMRSQPQRLTQETKATTAVLPLGEIPCLRLRVT